MKKILKLLIMMFLILPTSLRSQDLEDGFKNWWSVSLSARVNKKFSIKSSHLLGLNAEGFQPQFYQTNLSAAWRLNKAWSVESGLAHSQFYGKTSVGIFHRLFVKGSHRAKWDRWTLKTDLKAEWHFPQVRKYRYRFLWTQKLSYRFKKAPLRMTPYFKYQLQYYLDGKPVTFEGDEDEMEEMSPNGLHRLRLAVGVRMRLVKRLYLTPFFIWQNEFNLPFGGELNVENESTGKVQAPFNNYSVVGINLSYTFKLYK